MDTFVREILHSLHDEGRLDEFLGDDSLNDFFLGHFGGRRMQ